MSSIKTGSANARRISTVRYCLADEAKSMTSSTWQKCNRRSSRADLLISKEIGTHVDQNFQIRTLGGRGPRPSLSKRQITFDETSISQLPYGT